MGIIGGEYAAPSPDWSRMTEGEVVRIARSGSKEAFGELVRRHRSQVYGWASRMTRDAALAEDIVQDAFLDAYVQLRSLLDDNRFGSWLRAIVRNRANMKLRRGGMYRRERPASDTMFRNGRNDPPSDDVVAIIMHKERLCDMAEQLLILSKRERAVMEEILLHHRSIDEIARRLGITKVNVYNCVARARAKLKRETLRASLEAHKRRRRALGQPKQQVLHVGSVYF
ncbi:MAG: sigma-70 family RNA polymerase sigma factor [Paenibacillaceae bacterium]|nr:sigma-70 family RNA polymerase sigma factor [Paenibacillaceae bacterium]